MLVDKFNKDDKIVAPDPDTGPLTRIVAPRAMSHPTVQLSCNCNQLQIERK